MFSLIYFLLIGLAAGWIAGRVMGGGNWVWMLIVGVIGSYVGGFVIRLLGFSKTGNPIGEIISAAVGAIVLVLLLRKFG